MVDPSVILMLSILTDETVRGVDRVELFLNGSIFPKAGRALFKGVGALGLLLMACSPTPDVDALADHGTPTASAAPTPAPTPRLKFDAQSPSSACLGCHYTQFEYWQHSFHAQAYTDPSFLDAFAENGQSPMCLRCHMPVTALEAEARSGVFAPNARPMESENAHEGVSCVSCHLDGEGVIHGPTGVTEAGVAPHALVQDSRFESPELCAACHDDTVLGAFTQTVTEWRTQTDQSQNCQACHMAPKGAHRFPGGHDTAQLEKAFSVEIEVVDSHYQGRIRNIGAGHSAPTGDVYRAFYFAFDFVDGVDGSLGQTLIQLANPVVIEGLYHEVEGDVPRWDPLPAQHEMVLPLGEAPAQASAILARVYYYTLKPCYLESALVPGAVEYLEGGEAVLVGEGLYDLEGERLPF